MKKYGLNKELLNTIHRLISKFTCGKYCSVNMFNMQIHFIITKDNNYKGERIYTKLRMFLKIHKCKVVGKLY